MKSYLDNTSDTKLTEQAVLKSDLDILTIESLDKLAKDTGNILVLSGGYAVEAHCGGMITRAHGDVDAHLILTGSISNEELFIKVQELLDKENTKWAIKQKTLDKLDYIEDNDNNDFFYNRRIEVRLNTPHKYNIKYPKHKLINSNGEEVEVVVVDLNQMISQKLIKFMRQ
jgi:hypothetical protein